MQNNHCHRMTTQLQLIYIINSESSTLSIVFKTHPKHFCQPMDDVYGYLELKSIMVTSCQLPVRRPDLSLAFWGFAVCFKGVRKIGKYFC